MGNNTEHNRKNSLFITGRTVNFRPVVACAAALGMGIFFAEKLGLWGSLFAAALFCGLSLLAFKWGFRRCTLCLAALALGTIRMCCSFYELPEAGKYRITGRVVETPLAAATGQELILGDVALDGIRITGRIKLTLADENVYEYGNVISSEGVLSIPQPAMNEGGMDLNTYYRGQGIIALAAADNAAVSARNFDLYGWCLSLREGLERNIASLFPEHGGIVAGLLLGDKDGIPENDMQAFRDTGAAHLLAISGLHISIFATAVNCLLKRCCPKSRFVILGIFLLIYCAVTGFSPSVVRAAVMAMTAALAQILGRRYDAPSALAAAFLLLLLVQPYSLFQVGFQLSFSAVAGILLLQPVFSHLMKRLFSPLRDALSVSLSASIGIMPATLLTFHRLPLFGLVANLLAVPLAPLILLPALICAGTYSILPGFARILSVPVRFLIDILLSVIRIVSSIPGGVLYIAAPSALVCILFLAACFLFSVFFLRPIRTRLCCAGIVLLMCIACYILPQVVQPAVQLTALYQQYGGALAMRNGDSVVILDPGSGSYTPIVDWISYHGITKVDAVFVANASQAKAAAVLAGEAEIDHILVYGSDSSAKALLMGNYLFYKTFPKGAKMTLNDAFSVTMKDSLWVEFSGTTLAVGDSSQNASLRFGNGEEGSFHDDGLLILKSGEAEQQTGSILHLAQTGQLTIIPQQSGIRIQYDQPK